MNPASVLEGSSLAAAQARVAQVQQRIALLTGQSPAPRATTAVATPLAAGSPSFAEALAQAAGQAGPSTATPGGATGPGVVASAIRRLTGESAGTAAGGAVATDALLEASYLRPAALRAGQSSGAGAYQQLFDAATARHGLPAGLLTAVAKVESGYDATAVSPAGARGLMQIMPGTARDLGVDPMVPAQAVDGAARLLAQHLESFGSLPLALAAYNAGAGNVRKHGGIPPFAETQAYVKKVAAAQAAAVAPSPTRSA